MRAQFACSLNESITLLLARQDFLTSSALEIEQPFPINSLMKNFFKLFLPKTLQVLRHFARERQMVGIEAFDLFDAGPAFLARLKMLTLPCERMIRMQIAV